MKITRDGKQIELTINELNLAYCEMRRITWRSCMDDAINRAESEGNLRYGTMSRDEFLEECAEEMESMYGIEDWDEQCDEVLRATATYSADRKDGWLLRRNLPLSAALHIATCLRRCCGIRIVSDDPIPGTDTPALSDEELEVLPEAVPCPEPVTEEKKGLGFWGVVGAVLLALLIAAFL